MEPAEIHRHGGIRGDRAYGDDLSRRGDACGRRKLHGGDKLALAHGAPRKGNAYREEAPEERTPEASE